MNNIEKNRVLFDVFYPKLLNDINLYLYESINFALPTWKSIISTKFQFNQHQHFTNIIER